MGGIKIFQASRLKIEKGILEDLFLPSRKKRLWFCILNWYIPFELDRNKKKNEKKKTTKTWLDSPEN